LNLLLLFEERDLRENTKILMEETGCDEGQAELALQSTGNNLEEAIKSINQLLRHIVVIKGKFIGEEKNVYGWFIVISHLNQRNIIRLGAIVTYDPSIYEEGFDSRWRDFEKKLYAYRLKDGCLHELIQKIEQNLNWQIATDYRRSFFQNLKDRNYIEIVGILQTIIGKSLEDSQVKLGIDVEELNLSQFKFPQEATVTPEAGIKSSLTQEGELRDRKESTIVLKTELVSDDSSSSIEVEKLRKNDLVLVKICDSRDIALYLSRLLGGCKGEEVVPLSTVVEEIIAKRGQWVVRTRFGPGIMGESLAENGMRVRRLKHMKFATEMKRPKLLILWLMLIGAIIFCFLIRR